MSLFVRLKKYKNKTKSSYGKLYTETVYTGEVHTREIAKAVSENTTFRPGEVKGLIDEIVAEMKRQLQDSQIVVLDGLGRFRLVVESEGVEKEEDFNSAYNASSCLPARVMQNRRATSRTAELSVTSAMEPK